MTVRISAALVGACLISTTAFVYLTKVTTFGAWDALQGTGDAGDLICAIMATGPDRMVSIRNIHPNKYLTIIISKNSWMITYLAKLRWQSKSETKLI